MQKMAEDEGLEVIQPELGTKPRVWYRNLWRYATSFIGGSVSAEADGVVDCVEGATVTLSKEGSKIAENRYRYLWRLQVRQAGRRQRQLFGWRSRRAGHDSKTVAAELGESIYLGEIRL